MQKLCFWDESSFLRCESWVVGYVFFGSSVKVGVEVEVVYGISKRF